MANKLITIIVPAYNEERALPYFYSETITVLNRIPKYDFEILFINDGSNDRTGEVIKELMKNDNRISFLSLSRNFGKEIGMAAGIDYANGEAVVILDADLQHPPELIEAMISKWEDGYDDVYAQRISRKGESFMKKKVTNAYYKVLSKLSRIEMQKNAGDFRLLSNKAIEALRRLKESERYTKGLFALIGFKKVAIEYEPKQRIAGSSKWKFADLYRLAIEGITSFTTVPLKISTFLGFIFSIVAFIYLLIIVFDTFTNGEPIRGYPTLICTILLTGGIQMISLGVIGEYLGRVFNETKNRPLYFVDEYHSKILKKLADNENA